MPWRPQYYLAVAQPIGNVFSLYPSNTNVLPQKCMPQAWSTVDYPGRKQNSDDDDDDNDGGRKPKKKRSK